MILPSLLHRVRLLFATSLCILMHGSAVAADDRPAAPLPAGFKLVYQQNFQGAGGLSDFVASDPKAWQWSKTNGNGALALVKQSDYKPSVRSPFNITLLANRLLGDFVVEADLIQTGKEYGHRDMCLFFGFQSPTNFYYAHIATAADDHAHNIFIVNGAPRIKLARRTTGGVNWGLGVWHKVRLERQSGTVKVYFDDLEHPIMEAEDKTFGTGQIGFGSFDDTGMVDNIRVWAPSIESKRTSNFPSLGSE